MRIKKLLAVSLLSSLVFTGCASSDASNNDVNVDQESSVVDKQVDEQDNDKELEQDFKLVIGETEYAFSVQDIHSMESVDRTVTHYTSKGETVVNDVKGVLLETVLQQEGLSKKDYESARFSAGDGYAIDVPFDVLSEKEIILAYEFDGEPLVEEKQPFRLAINEERSMYYVSNLTSLELFKRGEKNDEKQTGGKEIVLLETAYSVVTPLEWSHYDEKCLAINVSDLFDTYGISGDKSINFVATDDFSKTEEAEVVTSGVLKIDGVDAPLFTGEDLPKGMQIKNILSMETENTIFTSLQSVMSTTELSTLGEYTGVKVIDLLDKVGSKSSEYSLVAADGYETVASGKDLKNAVLVIEEDKTITVRFDSSYPKNMTVKNLAMIKELAAEEGKEEGNEEKSNDKETEVDNEASQNEWEITVDGLSDGSFTFTSEKAQRKLEMVKLDTKRSKNDEEIAESWMGYKVSDVLDFLKVEGFESLTLTAGDGYEVTVLSSDLNETESIIAVQKDGEPLDSGVQFVQDTKFANTWIKDLKTIKVNQ